MLRGIDARLGADVLHALAAMGHGDMVVLVDANFPADAVARDTVRGTLLRMDNLDTRAAAEAILSVLPLDDFVDDFAARMEVVGDPAAIPPPQAEVQALLAGAGDGRAIPGVERFAFYDLARRAYAVIRTGEMRAYGCVAFRKGVLFGPRA